MGGVGLVCLSCFLLPFALPWIVSSGNKGSYGVSLVDCTFQQHDA